jgi:hypothetical protein
VSALEDRLRRELRAESEQITPDSIPPLSPPAHNGCGRRLLSLAHGGGERQGAPALDWRGWLTSVAAAIVVAAVIAGSGALSHALFRPKAPRATPAAVVGESPAAVAAETAARKAAVTWILHQVSRSEVVSCDPLVCGDLAASGFPSSSVSTLGPGSNDPLGSTLVMATAAIRNQFGSRLAIWAPAILASFGSGNARIDIRWVYPGGAAAYHATMPAALRARKAFGAGMLLKVRNVRLSATARTQVRSGQIDPHLAQLIFVMADYHRVRIVDFASQSPGGGPASLLRWVDLATTVRAAHLTPAAYLSWMRSFVLAQRAAYHPAWVRLVTLPDGQAVLRIGYAAPSPLR